MVTGNIVFLIFDNLLNFFKKTVMKYIILILLFCLTTAGCSSSLNSEKKNQDLKLLKKSVDSLRVLMTNLDRTLDSLNSMDKRKTEELMRLQIELDSLNKNLD